MMMRRRAWSLISARNAGTLIALAHRRRRRSTPAPFGPWQPAQARAKTSAPRSRLPGAACTPSALGERVRGRRLRRAASSDFQCDLMPSASTLTWSSVSEPPLLVRERRHRRAGAAVADHAQQLLVGNDRHEQRIVERRRGAKLAVRAVAAGAVRGEEPVEIHDLVGHDRSVGGIRLARRLAAAATISARKRSTQRSRECVRVASMIDAIADVVMADVAEPQLATKSAPAIGTFAGRRNVNLLRCGRRRSPPRCRTRTATR